VVGITNVRAIWGDEAGKYSLYYWENIQSRASFRQCPILLTTTPYARNWVYKEIIKPYNQGITRGKRLIQASSDENPYFPKEEFERKRETMDKRRFAALYLGLFTQIHGRVYDIFDGDIHAIAPIELPAGTKFYGGIDWGFTDPFVLNIRAITPTGFHFHVSEFYKTGLTITDMIIVAKQKKQIYGIQTFFADPSQPGYIEEFNRNGLTCTPAKNDIRMGIDAHYNLMKEGKYKVFDTSSHIFDEYEQYAYPAPEDLGPEDESKEQLPVGQFDHSMDSERYLTVMTVKVFDKKKPTVHDEATIKEPSPTDHTKLLSNLQRAHKKFKGSENWS
jgi:hypothetical protein